MERFCTKRVMNFASLDDCTADTMEDLNTDPSYELFQAQQKPGSRRPSMKKHIWPSLDTKDQAAWDTLSDHAKWQILYGNPDPNKHVPPHPLKTDSKVHHHASTTLFLKTSQNSLVHFF